MTGLILVFDLDQTLIDSTNLLQRVNEGKKLWNLIESHLNMRIIDTILRPALQLRGGKGVDAIFLLSNNNSSDYVINIIHYLSLKLGVDDIFDYVMIRNHPSRERTLNPPKRLVDVEFMVNNMITPISYSDKYSLARRVYFFDDNTKHLIRDEIPYDHYIEIQGPDVDVAGNNKGFIIGKPDLSDYYSIESELHILESNTYKTNKFKSPMKGRFDPPFLALDSLNHGGSRKRRKAKSKNKYKTRKIIHR